MKRNLWAGAVAIGVLVFAVVYSDAVRSEILMAGERCLTVLIPSLYFFSMLGAFLICSGGLQAIGRLLGKRGALLVSVLFSQIGGYPVGAQLVHEMRLRGQLNAAQERGLLCVCIGCGPGFLLGTVCRGMPLGLSLWMLLAVSVPNLVLFACLPIRVEETAAARPLSLVESAAASADRAAAAMLRITAMVLAFAGCMGIFEGTGLPALLAPLWHEGLRSILEVSCVSDAMSQGISLPAAAALLSFGGICVHLQIAAICEGNLAWGRFYLCRFAAAGMAYGITWIGVKWMFRNAVTTALTSPRPALTTGSILPGLCLLVMAVMTLKKGHAELGKR